MRKVEEGGGRGQEPRTGENKETDSPGDPPEAHSPTHLDGGPEGPVSDPQARELYGDSFVLF